MIELILKLILSEVSVPIGSLAAVENAMKSGAVAAVIKLRDEPHETAWELFVKEGNGGRLQIPFYRDKAKIGTPSLWETLIMVQTLFNKADSTLNG